MSLFDKKINKADVDHLIVNAKDSDFELFESFVKKYDSGHDLRFGTVPFRKGAVVTGVFGLDEGFKKDESGEMIWGYVRDHTGVDRAGGGTDIYEGKTISDVVVVPFDFEKSSIIEYGNKSYGTLISLYNLEYQFEFRIAHMNPNVNTRKKNEKGPLLPKQYSKLKKKMGFTQGEILGSAGCLGDSSGAHTHTEIKSLDESCEVFDILLYQLYKDIGLTEYSTGEVLELFRKQPKYEKSLDKDIFKDYNELRKEKRIIFMNKYKTQYIDFDGTVKSRYASNLLFNGL